MGYRLTGPPPLCDSCCVLLRGRDRAVVAFEPDRAVVLLVGPHDEQDAAADIHNTLYALAGVHTKPLGQRTKPSCCDDVGSGPTLLQADMDALVERSRALLRRR
jgi:hypothetical protein